MAYNKAKEEYRWNQWKAEMMSLNENGIGAEDRLVNVAGKQAADVADQRFAHS